MAEKEDTVLDIQQMNFNTIYWSNDWKKEKNEKSRVRLSSNSLNRNTAKDKNKIKVSQDEAQVRTKEPDSKQTDAKN